MIKWTHVLTGLVQYATTHIGNHPHYLNLHSMTILELVFEWESDILNESYGHSKAAVRCAGSECIESQTHVGY